MTFVNSSLLADAHIVIQPRKTIGSLDPIDIQRAVNSGASSPESDQSRNGSNQIHSSSRLRFALPNKPQQIEEIALNVYTAITRTTLTGGCLMPSPKNQILEEIRILRREVERLEGLIEERLIPISKPLPDEVDVIRGYAKDKKTGRLEFERLENL